tara:strand:- start:974 stop:3382 length:2409 start_codon:yes stop_codon:yes gene_type:complete
MELALASGVLGLGFFLNKDGKKQRKSNVAMNSDGYTQENIYESKFHEVSQKKEKDLACKSFNDSKDPIKTNVVPPQMNNNIFNNCKQPIQYLQNKDDHMIRENPVNLDNNNQNVYSKLTNTHMTVENFKHNNMVPFFGGTATQSVDVNVNNHIMEKFTGVPETYEAKKEISPMFGPDKNMGFVYGTPNYSDREMDRINTPKLRNNETPIDKIHVGPGLNKGYGHSPSGGFGQNDARDYVGYKTVDELRTANNPKISYKQPLVSGKAFNDKRQNEVTIEHYNPDRYYENNEDKYFTTTGAYVKEKGRPTQIIRDTHRKITKSYAGPAGHVTNKGHKQRADVRKSRKDIYRNDWIRNAGADNNGVMKRNGDYGKSGFKLPANERDVTGVKTNINNITSTIKAIIAPLLDDAKVSKKQNVIGNNREAGNFATRAPHKQTIYDPEDVARTTIKETNIHDSEKININPNKLGPAYDPEDVARTTIKETNVHDERTGWYDRVIKGPVYDEGYEPRTTMKELDVNNEQNVNIDMPGGKGPAYDPEDISRTTIKETNLQESDKLNMNPHKVGPAYDPEDIARTTIKETELYEDYSHNLNGPKQMKTYDPEDIARTTTKEMDIDNNYTPVGKYNKDSGYLTNPKEAPTTHRETTEDNKYGGHINKGDADGYKLHPKDVPNTNRQFTSDYDYTGNAGSSEPMPMSYSDIYNATLNEIKEGTLQGRKPTQEGNKIAKGSDMENISFKKFDHDRENHRDMAQNKVVGGVHIDPSECQITNNKDTVVDQSIFDRNAPDILDAFKENPYTQALDSL